MLYRLSYASPDRSNPRPRRRERMERETGIEPATNSLEGCDSTIELLPPEPCHHGAHASDAPYYSMGKGKGAATEAARAGGAARQRRPLQPEERRGNGGRPSRRRGRGSGPGPKQNTVAVFRFWPRRARVAG